MNCHRDEVTDDSILRSITFASKSFTGAEKGYSNIEREVLCMAVLVHWYYMSHLGVQHHIYY